ncbi:MAG: hypothetical protein JWN25_3613 [Verrucomicrobiales bacterium]|nr:hypothetical protein [Verrucomicrobiales bacterium]
MAYLPGHVEAMAAWIHEVEEILVVDSESSDGTVEYLRENLKHPNVRILSHPPGLYQSWNFGISQVSSKYTYISTTGDTITLAGLKHLLEVAENLRADVVISPPEFRFSDGVESSAPIWPIHEMIRVLNVTAPLVVERPRLFCSAFIFAVGRGLSGITGSAASDLFLTKSLQARPFPCDCGTVGDTFWGLHHSVDLTFAITPEKHSTFLFHPKHYNPNAFEYNLRLIDRAITEGKALFYDRMQPGLADQEDRWELLVFDLFDAIDLKLRCTVELDVLRDKNKLWVLNPLAWRMRYARNFYRRQIKKITSVILSQVPYDRSWLDQIHYHRLADLVGTKPTSR